MDTAMMWFDSNPKTDLAAKIKEAAEFYSNKYHKTPTLCFVHPSMEGTAPAGIELRSMKSIRPNHFWIGIGEDKENAIS